MLRDPNSHCWIIVAGMTGRHTKGHRIGNEPGRAKSHEEAK